MAGTDTAAVQVHSWATGTTEPPHYRKSYREYGTVRYGTVRYGTVRYGTIWYGMVRESYRESNRSQPIEHFLLFSDQCGGDPII